MHFVARRASVHRRVRYGNERLETWHFPTIDLYFSLTSKDVEVRVAGDIENMKNDGAC